ncbi:MAG: hypothetical protein ACOYNS_07935 [Bacteroidota bacterium]
MNRCTCETMQTLLHAEEFQSFIGSNVMMVDSTPMSDLFRCSQCGQLWRCDRPKNLRGRLMMKLECEEDWKTHLMTSGARTRLLENMGGVSANFCLWGNCSNYRVKGLEYCIDHLYYG